MRKFIYTGLGAAALIAGSVAMAAPAMASTGPGSNGQTGQLTGKNAISYADPFFGNVTCNETQHPKFDTVSCSISPANLGLAGTSGTFTNGWTSDFGDRASVGTLTYTVNADGTGYTGQATYPNG
jgi:hypothetical protein